MQSLTVRMAYRATKSRRALLGAEPGRLATAGSQESRDCRLARWRPIRSVIDSCEIRPKLGGWRPRWRLDR